MHVGIAIVFSWLKCEVGTTFSELTVAGCVTFLVPSLSLGILPAQLLLRHQSTLYDVPC